MHLNIGGLIKQTLIDYPGNISTMAFTKGCNFRCPYCHNAHLVEPERMDNGRISTEDVLDYLSKNKILIDALVISGGEPTLHKDLIPFAETVKQLGFKIKLDTNGTNPTVVEKLIQRKLVDFIAMDIKTELEYEKYNEITGGILTPKMFDDILHTIDIIKKSGIDHQFRTTVLKPYHNAEVIRTIKKQLGNVADYKINGFEVGETTICKLSEEHCFSETELQRLS